ncbi:MAG: hypothetical protein HY865_01640 [Chloroflexi bacterium]|nr:hypothetical protein [Chloroflexota bacterium]
MSTDLEAQLNDFSFSKRTEALDALIASETQLPAEQEVVNLHCHTFFSFNAYGYSPMGLARLAKQKGFKALGIVDFDVLDAVDEFLDTCERIGVRGSAGMETRAYVPEFSAREINSPGEPGVYYYMGIGFTSSQVPTEVGPILADMRARAAQRNRVMVERINAHLSPVIVDYDKDVLPLTPAGNATERHMLAAYVQAATKHFADPAPFWAEKLGLSEEQVCAQIGDAPKFQNTIRSKLMKRGGVGYAQPGPDTFPSVDEVNRLIVACGALPCAAWLDGTTAGEEAIEELLELLIAKGAVALNIVPDRNWNIPDPETRKLKVKKLYEVVELAQKLDLPLNIGTEMNAFGQRLVDDFDAPEMLPLRQPFLDGAYFIYGHTLMQRTLKLGYQSEWAKSHLPTRRERNAFYTELGKLVPPGKDGTEKLKPFTSAMSPAEMLGELS